MERVLRGMYSMMLHVTPFPSCTADSSKMRMFIPYTVPLILQGRTIFPGYGLLVEVKKRENYTQLELGP